MPIDSIMCIMEESLQNDTELFLRRRFGSTAVREKWEKLEEGEKGGKPETEAKRKGSAGTI